MILPGFRMVSEVHDAYSEVFNCTQGGALLITKHECGEYRECICTNQYEERDILFFDYDFLVVLANLSFCSVVVLLLSGKRIFCFVPFAALPQDRINRCRKTQTLIDGKLGPLNGREIVNKSAFSRKRSNLGH